MTIDRRQFATGFGSLTTAAALNAIGLTKTYASFQTSDLTGKKPLFIATWNFGLAACQQSLKTLQGGGSVLDAVEQGIRVTEADTSVDSVGVGGAPNSEGVVQLDACIMDGTNQKAGSVAALEDYPHPISVARKVMELTPHVMLVGKGASEFAKAQGFEKAELLTPQQKKRWQEWQASQAAAKKAATQKVDAKNHDTIALLGLDEKGVLAGGCSTSGLAFKLPGRVGDSPILGSGLFVDGEVGAAGGTGIGENIMRYCGSFLIVEMMRGGLEPAEACRKTIERIARLERREANQLHINFVAIDKQGRFGAAGTDESFEAAVVTKDSAQLIKPLLVR